MRGPIGTGVVVLLLSLTRSLSLTPATLGANPHPVTPATGL